MNNPFHTGKGRLQVGDFGCGALAMKFGLALGSGRTLAEEAWRTVPVIAVVPDDDSECHARIRQQKAWCRFVNEIADQEKYPYLEIEREL